MIKILIRFVGILTILLAVLIAFGVTELNRLGEVGSVLFLGLALISWEGGGTKTNGKNSTN